jgi:hypothetical protein
MGLEKSSVIVRNPLARASHTTFGECTKKRAKKMKPLPRNIKDWPLLFREAYEERAGIIEFQGNKTREEAQRLAEEDIRRGAA